MSRKDCLICLIHKKERKNTGELSEGGKKKKGTVFVPFAKTQEPFPCLLCPV